MLVSHRYKFIYTKTVKTASTSVESFFERFCMPEGEWEQLHQRDDYESASGIIGFRGKTKDDSIRWWNHMPADTIREQLGDEIWNSYFKFCVVRNPYEKCISAFEHIGRNFQLDEEITSEILVNNAMTLEQYRFYEYIRQNPPIDRDKYLINGVFCLDDVIRYESLESELKRICNHLWLPFEQKYLPTFKKGFRRQEATVDRLFSPLSRQLVKQNFAFEIDCFNYTFPEV